MIDQQQPAPRRGAGVAEEAYDPWQPKVSDRVRVRLSAECPGAMGGIRMGYMISHDVTLMDGRICRVVSVAVSDALAWQPDSWLRLAGGGLVRRSHPPVRVGAHRFVVETEEPVENAGRTYHACCTYAAIELEPLDRTALAEAGSDGGEGER